jgi:hypothetical protein
MATRGINKLSALQVKKAKPDPDKMYKLSDGGNLYLRIDQSGSKYWIFNYTRPFLGKRNDLSLGTYPEVSLDDARTIRDEYKNSSSRALTQQWSGLKPSLRNRKKQKIPFVLLLKHGYINVS